MLGRWSAKGGCRLEGILAWGGCQVWEDVGYAFMFGVIWVAVQFGEDLGLGMSGL